MKLYYPLIGSIITITLGAILLYSHVPLIITIGSMIDIGILSLTTYLLYKGVKYAETLGLAISLLQIVGNSLDPVHMKALLSFGSSIYISVLDVLMILSFYAFPLLYILLFINSRIRRDLSNR